MNINNFSQKQHQQCSRPKLSNQLSRQIINNKIYCFHIYIQENYSFQDFLIYYFNLNQLYLFQKTLKNFQYCFQILYYVIKMMLKMVNLNKFLMNTKIAQNSYKLQNLKKFKSKIQIDSKKNVLSTYIHQPEINSKYEQSLVDVQQQKQNMKFNQSCRQDEQIQSSECAFKNQQIQIIDHSMYQNQQQQFQEKQIHLKYPNGNTQDQQNFQEIIQ
ncbi:hypothetical protein TTHERM_00487159 (macronuclear) [Tetrahymena thermophila SB210]|uniref:Uncharacterized protein n=1 Tax=Tetrahymena thermophila (strain SB210) TaxID=312017 RepID=A4VF18_TETTS|nr:hypothetical protein TTHERM_00487159 [Tetrahymena thermophila SB210]EDK31246.1 hypothetical protein TTHERM_00487159 [Tetrahymena thermophila SB210]|eukprot:XP_001470676.1 hypothetical protein TTHERM_00487159 [Tetrahymena thermophila SB210]